MRRTLDRRIQTLTMSRSSLTCDRNTVLQQLQNGQPVEWPQFFEACAPTIDRVVRLFGRDYDERMELFLQVCERLRARSMRRVRAFNPAKGPRCEFTTYLVVVVRHLVIDIQRQRHGRFRMFSRIRALDAVDRLIADYRFRQGRPESEIRELLEQREGRSMSESEFSTRMVRIDRALTPSQRWRLLARWSRKRPPVAVDPTDGPIETDRAAGTITATRGNPQGALSARDARRVFSRAMASLTARQKLVMAYRFVDGHDVATTARAMGISSSGVERLTRESVRSLRRAMGQGRVTREDLERSFAHGVQEAGPS